MTPENDTEYTMANLAMGSGETLEISPNERQWFTPVTWGVEKKRERLDLNVTVSAQLSGADALAAFMNAMDHPCFGAARWSAGRLEMIVSSVFVGESRISVEMHANLFDYFVFYSSPHS